MPDAGLGVLLAGGVPAAPPPEGAARQERAAERDRCLAEAKRLSAAGRWPEAVAAAERMLAIEREFVGDAHSGVAASLEFLTQLRLRSGAGVHRLPGPLRPLRRLAVTREAP